MPRFRFRLQTLRRLREIHRDEQRARLAEAYEAERLLAQQQADVDRQLGEAAGAQRQLVATGAIDVNRVLSVQRYQLVLLAQQRTLAEQAARLSTEVENRRLALVEADRQVRILDRLEQRQRERHALDRDRAEAKRMDEIALTRRGRSTWVE
jgi:flagellar FliJ protein